MSLEAPTSLHSSGQNIHNSNSEDIGDNTPPNTMSTEDDTCQIAQDNTDLTTPLLNHTEDMSKFHNSSYLKVISDCRSQTTACFDACGVTCSDSLVAAFSILFCSPSRNN
ncbi:MAG: hypothetical protein HAW66_07520 [Shewanella sp.]|nr:hypothetical protein [Shewanella sp.]